MVTSIEMDYTLKIAMKWKPNGVTGGFCTVRWHIFIQKEVE
jgi:hypothetical protein